MEPHWHCHINFYNASVRRHPDHWMNTSSAAGIKCYQIFFSESIDFIPTQKPMEFHSKFMYILESMKAEDFYKRVILSHSKDNVATAKSPIKAKTLFLFPKGEKVEVREEIPFGHKISLRRIPKGGPVIKYGERIGRAIRTIKIGELVHIHNVVGERGKSKSKNIG